MNQDHSQLKSRELPWKNNETDLFSLRDTKFKKEIMKITKDLGKSMNRNADYCKKELQSIKRSQEKSENSFAEMKAKLQGNEEQIEYCRRTNKWPGR